jgi:hypothetical protein
MCLLNRGADAPSERAVQPDRIVAMHSSISCPPRVLSDALLGSDSRSTYDVDFDDFFVLHLLDEVVTCVEDSRAVLGKEIERV